MHINCLFQDTFVLQSCIVTSPISNTIRVLCEFLGASRRISVNATCTSCEGTQTPVTAVGNSPLDIAGLQPESYTLKVIAVDSSNKRLGNNSVMQTITVNTGIVNRMILFFIGSLTRVLHRILKFAIEIFYCQ